MRVLLAPRHPMSRSEERSAQRGSYLRIRVHEALLGAIDAPHLRRALLMLLGSAPGAGIHYPAMYGFGGY